MRSEANSTAAPLQSTPPTTTTSAATKAQATRRRAALVTPNAATTTTTAVPKVDKQVVDELLLVCSVIGSHDNASGKFVPVTDCLQWLQDLQRALRRDDDAVRSICLLVGDWKVVEQKLLPLCLACRYDTPLILTVCKILVMLTKPLSTAAQRAAVLPINTKNKAKTLPAVVQAQAQMRENALKQAAQLLEYKRVLTTQFAQFFHVLVSLLAAPLAKARQRTQDEHLCIEIVLHLLRNILSAKPLLRHNADEHDQDAMTHHQLLQVLEEHLVLDVVCVLCADLDQAGSPNAAYNLILMETQLLL